MKSKDLDIEIFSIKPEFVEPYKDLTFDNSEKFKKMGDLTKDLDLSKFKSNDFKIKTGIGAELKPGVDWSPSYWYPTFKFINEQAFGAVGEKRRFVCKNNNVQEKYIKKIYNEYPDTDSNSPKVKTSFNKSIEQLKQIFSDKSNPLTKFLFWNLAINRTDPKTIYYYPVNEDSKIIPEQVIANLGGKNQTFYIEGYPHRSLKSWTLNFGQTNFALNKNTKEHAIVGFEQYYDKNGKDITKEHLNEITDKNYNIISIISNSDDFTISSIATYSNRNNYKNVNDLFIFAKKFQYDSFDLYKELRTLLEIIKAISENNEFNYNELMRLIIPFIIDSDGNDIANLLYKKINEKWKDNAKKIQLPCIILDEIRQNVETKNIFSILEKIISEVIIQTNDGQYHDIYDLSEYSNTVSTEYELEEVKYDFKKQGPIGSWLKNKIEKGDIDVEDAAYYMISKTFKLKEITGPCFNLDEYLDIIVGAIFELFKLPIFEYYNEMNSMKYIADNMLVAGMEKRENKDEFKDPGRKALHNEDIRKSMRDETNAIYYLDDYNWSMSMTSLNKMGLSVNDFQYLKVYEFQQDKQVSFKKLADSMLSTLEKFGSAIETKGLGNIINAGLQTGIEAIIKHFMSNDLAIDHANKVGWISDMISGIWLAEYDIPIVNKDFIIANSSDKWTMGNLADGHDFVKNDLTINVQDIPTWQYDPNSKQKLETKFYLLNETIEDLFKNLKFLYSFASGAFWVQDTEISYRAPNIYRIVLPGRFVWLYSVLDIKAEFLGKVKKYSMADAKKIFGNAKYAPFNRFTDSDGDCNIPEAYSVVATFTNLTPNAFNVYSAYNTLSYKTESYTGKDDNGKDVTYSPTDAFIPNINVIGTKSTGSSRNLFKIAWDRMQNTKEIDEKGKEKQDGRTLSDLLTNVENDVAKYEEEMKKQQEQQE